MYLMREVGNILLPQIGEVLGCRDHTTVEVACDKINDMTNGNDRSAPSGGLQFARSVWGLPAIVRHNL